MLIKNTAAIMKECLPIISVDLDLDLDKYVAGPFSIYATEERAGKNTSPSEKQLS